jgi:hypothetical protein
MDPPPPPGPSYLPLHAGVDASFKPSLPAESAEEKVPESPALVAAREAAETAATALSSAERALESAKSDLGADFGPDGVFYTLKGSCFSLKHNQYTYEACPFGSAKQDHTSLGSFSGWGVDGGAADYSKMRFSGGSVCWNGPARSMRLDFECGAKDELLSIDEPEKCAYVARMATPAACDGRAAQALKLEIDEHGEL